MYDVTSATITQLKADGRKIICAFAAGIYERSRSDANSFPDYVIGNDVTGLDGAKWLDVSSYQNFSSIIEARLDVAVSKGCDGVEASYLDGY